MLQAAEKKNKIKIHEKRAKYTGRNDYLVPRFPMNLHDTKKKGNKRNENKAKCCWSGGLFSVITRVICK